jgi:hypothetical protein
MQGRPVNELLDVPVERPTVDQLKIEVGRTKKDRVVTRLTGDDGKNGQLDAVDEAGTINARFIDRLPYERNGDRKPVCLYTTTARQRPCLLPSADCAVVRPYEGTLVIKRPRTMHQTPGPVSGGKGPKIVPVS